MFRLVLDPIIFEIQGAGGLSRVYREVLPRVCDLDPEGSVLIATGGSYRQALPRHPRISEQVVPPLERLLKPGRLWQPAVLSVRAWCQAKALAALNTSIWQSTYFTMPSGWRGPSVVLLADMVYERLAHLYPGKASAELRERKRRCVRAADAVVCISEATRADAKDIYGLDDSRLCVVPLAVSDSFLSAQPLYTTAGAVALQVPKPVARPFLLYVGMRAPHKNFPFLARAYSRWEGAEQYDLLLAGPALTAAESDLLYSLGIHGRVRVAPAPDDAALRSLYRAAAAFVYPSLAEGFGISPLEAMACGCPVLASRIPSTVEVAGSAALLFDPADEESLLSALSQVVKQGRASPRVQLGLARSRRYSWQETAQKMLRVYQSL